MDVAAAAAATSVGDKKHCFRKKGRHGRRRPCLRKTSAQPPTMQGEDKCQPKTEAEEWEQSKSWLSSKKTSQEAEQGRLGTNDGEAALRFTCCLCSNNLEYVAKDLERHFEEKHGGSPPVFSCHTCTFKAHEFSFLQIHLLNHKDTFSNCSICNDDVQRTWPEFSAHLSVHHCQNGKYSCETCQQFSTGDVRVFLGHMWTHNLGLEGARHDLSLLTKDKNMFGPKATTLRCQHCDHQASQKWLLTKHINAVHVCQNSNQGRSNKKVHSIAMKPNEPTPKTKPRLTRSAVKEMCWLTEDCLTLPGRDFLDKYCHLSDPQTTLEETQQFLMKSVAGETGEETWTKALKTVFSNVPQDVNLHPKSENGIMSNSSDLTVLTVKNKITVAQNGATYAKRLRMMTVSDRETVFHENAADEANCVVDQTRSDVTERLPALNETKLHNDASASAQVSQSTRLQENRENHKLTTDPEVEINGKTPGEPSHQDGNHVSPELKVTNESQTEPAPVCKVVSKNKRRRRKRQTRSRRAQKTASGLPLKIVLKKNPVKEKQWVSQSSLEGDPMDEGPQTSETSQVETAQSRPVTSMTDGFESAEVVGTDLQSSPGPEPGPHCAADQVMTGNMDGNETSMLEVSLSTDLDVGDEVKKQMSETGVDEKGTELETKAVKETEVELCPRNMAPQTTASSVERHDSDDRTRSAADEESGSADSESSPVSQPVITPQGGLNMGDPSLGPPEEQNSNVEDVEVPADSRPDPLSSGHSSLEEAIPPEPPASGPRWQPPLPKQQERTLKLVAINPSQLVKRPAGDQPVVVLNHPDADIPEVTRIMEVVNRYRGEVQKVVLSRRTLDALTALDNRAEVRPDSAGPWENCVQERFLLKLKLRRLSRKKYEVVDAVSPSREPAKKFRCWFCGRAFMSREVWMEHRRRHLMDWKGPNCENS